MSIYTKKGDKGKSSLLDRKLRSKDDLRFEVLGCLDEVNCFLGLARCYTKNKEINSDLEQIQNDLMSLGAIFAGHKLNFNLSQTQWLDGKIDLMDKNLQKLTGFILPGGTVFSSHLQIVRVVVRRTERIIVKLNRKEKVELSILAYVNRLSDYFFVLARTNLI